MQLKNKLIKISTYICVAITFMFMMQISTFAANPYISNVKVTNAKGVELSTVHQWNGFNIEFIITDDRVNNTTVIDDGTLLINAISTTPAVPSPNDGTGVSARLNTSNYTMANITNVMYELVSSSATNIVYKVTFNSAVYQGNEKNFDFSITYPRITATPVPLIPLSYSLTIATPMPTEPTTPTPPPVEAIAPTFAPKAIVSNKNEVLANEQFTVTGTIQNTSATEIIENVTATITTDDKLTLASGTNTIYLGNFAPLQEMNVNFALSPINTAEPGRYKASVSYSGTWKGQPVTVSQEIAVSVKQQERFEFSKLEYDEVMFPNEENYLSAYFVNKGKTIIYNLSAELKGENIANVGQQQFLGNVQSGTEQSVEFYVMPETAGIVKGIIVLTYEDDAGNVKILEKEFSATVEESMDPWGPMPPIEPEIVDPEIQAGMPIWVWFIVALVVIIILVVIIKVIKAKKKKALAKLDMEDDDEDI